jgi:DNA repair photolyase
MNTLTENQMTELSPSLRDPIEYRKSGLSLNHIIGCPLDCSYCVRHLFGNFEMKSPVALMSDDEAVQRLVAHRFFVAHVTPLQLFNRATDPLLPAVKPHLFRVLELLDGAGYTNHVLVISRFKFQAEDAEKFNQLVNLHVTLLFTYSGIDDAKMEPIDSGIAAESLKIAYSRARSYRVILYWRPLVPGLNDSDPHMERVLQLSAHCHAVVFSGLFFRDEIRAFFQEAGIPDPYSETARRKILPGDMESRIISAFRRAGLHEKLFRKTSCGVAYAHRVPDYNGHYGIREICDICPSSQVRLCANEHRQPNPADVDALVRELGGNACIAVTDRAAFVSGLDEQRRYFIQHRFRFQIHDVNHPHHTGRHGRAEIGWTK